MAPREAIRLSGATFAKVGNMVETTYPEPFSQPPNPAETLSEAHGSSTSAGGKR